MGARITALLDELEGKLKVVPAYATETLTFRRGANERAQEDAPPRVTWVLTAGTFSAREKGKRQNRRIITRRLQVLAVCWGKDIDATEQLLHDVLLNLHESAWGSIELLNEQWPEEQNMHLGIVAVLTFAVQIPVEETPIATTKLTTFETDTTASAQGDGYLDWGEP